MSVVRAVAIAAVLAALVVVAAVVLRGSAQTEYRLRFQNAGQLVVDNDVQVGGRRIGSVKEIELTGSNEAEIRIAVDDEFAPLTESTTAVIRATSLSGIANRYIALTKGPGRELDEGALLTAEKTTTPVDLDQLFATLDPPTRKALQKVISGSARQYDGVGQEANEALKYFNPALNSTSRLVNQLTADQRVFEDFVKTTSRVVGAVGERRAELTGLVANTNTAMQAIGDENTALLDALDVLPGTLRRANTTFVNLRATIEDLDTLVDASKPATRELAPLLKELRPLVADARPTIADLRQLITTPGQSNDLVELVRQAPRLERAAKPALTNSVAALRQSTPVLEFIRPYTPDLTGWLRDFGQTTANYDANGHFARVSPLFNAFEAGDGKTLDVLPAGDRPAPTTEGQFRRCPGAATQPAGDGSSPFSDGGKLDCDPSQVLPGS